MGLTYEHYAAARTGVAVFPRGLTTDEGPYEHYERHAVVLSNNCSAAAVLEGGKTELLTLIDQILLQLRWLPPDIPSADSNTVPSRQSCDVDIPAAEQDLIDDPEQPVAVFIVSRSERSPRR